MAKVFDIILDNKNTRLDSNVFNALNNLSNGMGNYLSMNVVITPYLNSSALEPQGYIDLDITNRYTDQEKRYEDWVTMSNMFDTYVNKALKVIFLDLDETEQNRILSEIDKLKERHCLSYTKGSSNLGLSNLEGGRRTRRKQTRRKNTKRRRH